ncbi:hypothetical protein AQUCO_00900447v1 [Aquilegia coerulea]|uniref:Uncharacterized protein n=1 Tax=Aquilegia coerulea TaxID=218851 RepID=A0A2G5EDS3_AQUCA|nr:hypothetical protein AQUCO_00900447v1 [Aquilegia coerulea]
MATRPVVPQQTRGEAVVEGAKQKVVKAGGNNRRALGDIGNLVTVRGVEGGKPLPQINRPVTRSFCAQLLANAQAQAAAGEKNKKQVPVLVDVAVVGKPGGVRKAVAVNGAGKVAQRKVAVKQEKPKPVEIIEISPDTVVEKQKEKSVQKASRAGGSSRKKVQTYTSVLTARSKTACGITNKPKETVVDIDAADAENELAAVEYVEDLYKYYKLAENTSRVHDYMDSQPDINIKMRAILVDWLIEVHHKFELTPETLYLTIYIVDRYLSVKAVLRKELQLVGISAMLIASKYEEIWAPEVNDFVCISDRAYSREQVLRMEKSILGRLEWSLTVPTPYMFLVRFIKAALSDQEMEHMVFFLAELGLMHYATIIYCPSMVAASAIYAARCTLNKTPLWNETLKLHTGFYEPQLMDCAKLLVDLHSGASANKLQVVYKKYSNPERNAVAVRSPAKNLLV